MKVPRIVLTINENGVETVTSTVAEWLPDGVHLSTGEVIKYGPRSITDGLDQPPYAWLAEDGWHCYCGRVDRVTLTCDRPECKFAADPETSEICFKFGPFGDAGQTSDVKS